VRPWDLSKQIPTSEWFYGGYSSDVNYIWATKYKNNLGLVGLIYTYFHLPKLDSRAISFE
jgi:hypothetical protein